jgi:hypothetical protein
METVKPEDRKRESYLVFPEAKLQIYFTEPLSPTKKRQLRLLTKLRDRLEPGVGFLVVRTDSPYFAKVLEIIEQEEGNSQDWVPEPPKEAPKTETSDIHGSYILGEETKDIGEGDDL